MKSISGFLIGGSVLAEKGEDPYEFDYLLLCNKICGASHYNMQMKIIVEDEDSYEDWILEQKSITELINK